MMRSIKSRGDLTRGRGMSQLELFGYRHFIIVLLFIRQFHLWLTFQVNSMLNWEELVMKKIFNT